MDKMIIYFVAGCSIGFLIVAAMADIARMAAIRVIKAKDPRYF